MKNRQQHLIDWLKNELGLTPSSFSSASSDASFRRYFRVTFAHSQKALGIDCDTSYIVMDAPPEHEKLSPFIHIEQILLQLGVNVPIIYAENHQLGALLLSDLGQQPYLQSLTDDNCDPLYLDAMQCLLDIQSADIHRLSDIPQYSDELLANEMSLFEQWFLKQHLQYSLTKQAQENLKQAYQMILNEIKLHPKVLVHRDFHSRNLMFQTSNNPGVIDFQDAVIGSCCYDLVSLFCDAYVSWPRAKVEQWLYQQFENMLAKKILHSNHFKSMDRTLQFKEFLRWFDFIALQRQLKVIGIFSRLFYRDNKSGYLNDIPQMFKYLFAIRDKYPELNDFFLLMDKIFQAYESNDPCRRSR